MKSPREREKLPGRTGPGRPALCLLLCLLLIWSPMVGCASRVATRPEIPLAPAVYEPLDAALDRSYLELFDKATSYEFSAAQIEQMRKYETASRDYCVNGFKDNAKEHDRELRSAQEELRKRSSSLNDAERRELHCRIQNARALHQQAQMLGNHAVPVGYENRLAKLELLEKWPAELAQIRQTKESGAHHARRWGDAADIGFREIARGQEDDVKTGQEAVRQMKLTGIMPPEIDNPVVRDYVTQLTRRIAAKSDLRVPAQVTVLNSKEINAFALPGGFLFVQRGLLEAAEDEAQLAGVMAHEIAHAAARHGHRLMRRATIASIIFQAAQVAAMILTGGIAGIGTYYALQYGFYGLGLFLSLDLLGVSRDFELEADQLGVQYAWNAGFDPTGFTRFFDKMATRVGYVRGASWFRTHPAFYQRMVETQREMHFLPEKDNLITDSPEFRRMKEALVEVTKQAEDEEKDRPSLLAPEKDCPKPPLIDYEPGKGVKELCRHIAT